MNRNAATLGLLIVLGGCSKHSATAPRAAAPEPAVRQQPEAIVPPPGTGPDARTPLGHPASGIDPKSPEAARAVVERYCALLKAGRFDEAHELWLGDNRSHATFAASWARYGKVERCAVGGVGRLEGAAGSIYTTVAVEILFNGGDRLSGPLTLRRTNDVPGSTDEQRRWHIVQSGLKVPE